jgi:hypothetical protein
MTLHRSTPKVISALLIVGIVPIAMAALASGRTSSSKVIPSYAHKVAEGQPDGQSSWGIWVFGRQKVPCWATRNVNHELVDETAYCGFQVPAEPWQLAVRGTYKSRKGQRSLLFFFTRAGIRTLEVQVERTNAARITPSLSVKRLTAKEARGAHIETSFGFAFAEFPGRMDCVMKVVATNRSGRQVAGSAPRGCP